MNVAVITPYFREPLDLLQTCHNSVVSQTHPCTHVLVSDGFPKTEVAAWPIQHIVLPKSHSDVGNTPRAIGSLSAMNQGFDAIAYLDADNWYYSNHIESMVKLHEQTGAAVCTATRTIHRLDGSLLFLDVECDGKNQVDTNCYFFTKHAFRLLPLWAMMPAQMGPIGDRMILNVIRILGLSTAHNPQPTVAFRSQYAATYQLMGETPPPGTKTADETYGGAAKWWDALSREAREEIERRMNLRK